jgi:hypothetical protein
MTELPAQDVDDLGDVFAAAMLGAMSGLTDVDVAAAMASIAEASAAPHTAHAAATAASHHGAQPVMRSISGVALGSLPFAAQLVCLPRSVYVWVGGADGRMGHVAAAIPGVATAVRRVASPEGAAVTTLLGAGTEVADSLAAHLATLAGRIVYLSYNLGLGAADEASVEVQAAVQAELKGMLRAEADAATGAGGGAGRFQTAHGPGRGVP